MERGSRTAGADVTVEARPDDRSVHANRVRAGRPLSWRSDRARRIVQSAEWTAAAACRSRSSRSNESEPRIPRGDAADPSVIRQPARHQQEWLESGRVREREPVEQLALDPEAGHD